MQTKLKKYHKRKLTEYIPCGSHRWLPKPTHHRETPDISGSHLCVHLRSLHFPCYYWYTAARNFHTPVGTSLKHVSKNFTVFTTSCLPNNNVHKPVGFYGPIAPPVPNAPELRSQLIWTIMVAAKLDQSRVLVTKFHQNWLTLKGRSAVHRQTDS